MADEPMDVDDSNTPTSSQGMAIQSQNSNADLSTLSTELVRYFLFKQCNRTPIKRSDILKDVLFDYKKYFDKVMTLAKDELLKVFGVEVVAISRDQGDESIKEKTKTSAENRYFLRNTLPTENQNIINSTDHIEEYGLLTIILAIIFMIGGTMKETDLVDKLQALLEFDKRKPHYVFGDISKKIDQFVKTMYLHRTKELVNGEFIIEYSWGQRSRVEVDKMEILRLVSDLMDIPVESLTSQYQEAMQQ
ncbi:Non-structural maintenance of chromosomes element 3-like protein [Trichoplax sp. H2]|uniref:MAGE domain-containing protein n=1 Tax=Trichoplax adhaerens TaxID=10228 RepID=B3S2A2_TRIAD|nr:hypothetical protein TRIADDRAFT_58431 [Trichoplax adhaerens]EDV23611.1 hypothetical protein TRIADDRAFT_58431 [Trichoplax adhaerens]RDD38365.1 Non-structural maintenance of chromosomes element 3-like protein [Trichoplax sp. H2]|eukprot:XP_002114521.1 hypothetical protein TRIADDRAFT_58431 [Trichoplax adhaerens]